MKQNKIGAQTLKLLHIKKQRSCERLLFTYVQLSIHRQPHPSIHKF